MPVWLALGSLSFGLPSEVLSVFVPLKCTCMPVLLHSFLNLSPVLCRYGTTMVMFFLFVSVLLLLLLVVVACGGLLNLSSQRFSAQGGKWHCCKADLICFISFSRLACVEETTLALCAKVLNTLCFDVM